MARYLISVLLAAALPSWAAAAAPAGATPGETLLQADRSLNHGIMSRGNDRDDMLNFMDDASLSFSHRRITFERAKDVYRKLPPGPTPANVLTLYTEYALVSAAGDVGVTYGAWNSRFYTDSVTMRSDLFNSYFVFGFNSGLWSAKWSPRGAPRQLYHQYLRVWRPIGPKGAWRLVGGNFVVERLQDQALPPALEAAVHGHGGAARGVTAAVADAMDGDRALSELSSTRGGLAAYSRYGDTGFRLLTDFDPTMIGGAALAKSLTRRDDPFTLQPLGQLAAAGDLVCTYGYTHQPGDGPDARPTGEYINVWGLERDGWRLLITLINIFNT